MCSSEHYNIILISFKHGPAENLLNPSPSPSASPSRIPILSPKHQRYHHMGRRISHDIVDSSDYSGGSSYSGGDLTSSVDSGVDVREIRAHLGHPQNFLGVCICACACMCMHIK